MAKDEVELMPAPTPHKNLKTKDKPTKTALLSTKSKRPSPHIETIYGYIFSQKLPYNEEYTEYHAACTPNLVQKVSSNKR